MSTGKADKGKQYFFLASGILVLVAGIVFIASGVGILVYNKSADAAGYHWSNVTEVRTSTYAFTLDISSLSDASFAARLGAGLFGADNAFHAKWRFKSLDSSRELFVGISKVADGEKYTSSMETENGVWSWDGPFRPEINITSKIVSGQGLAGPADPAWKEKFWSEATFGIGTLNIDYNPVWASHADDKYMIIMNSDGTRNVAADIQMGYSMPVFSWLPYRLIPLGVLICLGGILLIRRRNA